MVDTITQDVVKSDLKEVVCKLLPDSIAKDIEKKCQGIYPLHDVYIRKVCFIWTLLIFFFRLIDLSLFFRWKFWRNLVSTSINYWNCTAMLPALQWLMKAEFKSNDLKAMNHLCKKVSKFQINWFFIFK